MIRFPVFTFVVVLCAAYLHAQAGNVYGGYSFVSNDLHANYNDGRYGSYFERGRGNLNGWNVSGEIKVFHWIGLVADFNGSYGSAPIESGNLLRTTSINTHMYTFLFGPRASVDIGKIRPFGEALVGMAQQTVGAVGTTEAQDDSNLATAFGGGLDYRLLARLSWRVQADYIGTRLFGYLPSSSISAPVERNFRISTGIVFPF